MDQEEIPWVVAGTGPSLKPLDRSKYRIFALNRAIHYFPVVDAWGFAHRLTFEACRDQLHKTPIVLTGDRFATDPGVIMTRDFLPLYQAASEKLKILHNHEKDLPAIHHFHNSPREQYWGTSTVACLAACWIARQGQDVFYSVGIDGGRDCHEDLSKATQNRFAKHGKPDYDYGHGRVRHLVSMLRMTWEKL